MQKFFLYESEQFPSAPHILDIIHYYKSLNILHVQSWNIDYNPRRRCQLAQINECVLKNAYFYRFVAVCDYDELIIPVANQNWTLLKLVRSLDRADAGSFTFTAKYQVTNRSDVNVTIPWENVRNEATSGGNFTNLLERHLPWRGWRNVSGFISRDFSPKTIVKPETVRKMWVHFVHKHYKGFKTNHVDPYKKGTWILASGDGKNLAILYSFLLHLKLVILLSFDYLRQLVTGCMFVHHLRFHFTGGMIIGQQEKRMHWQMFMVLLPFQDISSISKTWRSGPRCTKRTPWLTIQSSLCHAKSFRWLKLCKAESRIRSEGYSTHRKAISMTPLILESFYLNMSFVSLPTFSSSLC